MASSLHLRVQALERLVDELRDDVTMLAHDAGAVFMANEVLQRQHAGLCWGSTIQLGDSIPTNGPVDPSLCAVCGKHKDSHTPSDDGGAPSCPTTDTGKGNDDDR